MDYTYVSDSVLLEMKNQQQNQENSPRKIFFLFSSVWFAFLWYGGGLGICWSFFWLVGFLRRRRRKE